MSHRVVSALAIVMIAGSLIGCGKHESGSLVANQIPIVALSSAPAQGSTEYYSRRLNWFAFDPDGQVTGYQYAIDPLPGVDTTWVETTSSEANLFFRSPNPDVAASSAAQVQISLGQHTFVVKARDNLGALSAPAFVSFTSRTVAPATNIILPLASSFIATTTPSLTINWRGEDIDGVLTQKPIKYKFKLVPGSEINPAAPTSATAQEVQAFFSRDAATFFASWDSVPGDTTFKAFEGLTAGTVYYFAVVAFDEAGAYEPRFLVGANVLRFRPSLDRLGPTITVFNEFFVRAQSFGGVDPTRFVRLEIPESTAVTFNWFATSPTPGPVITGYRWALDIDDISDETARENDGDLKHWSPWSGTEVSATIGPFTGSSDTLVTHNFFIEARDNIGFISLFPIQLTIVRPTFENPLLLVDDLQGKASQAGRTFIDSYPMEAEQDSFYCAVGNVPDSIGIKWRNDPSALSTPGMFSEFVFDTLDYFTFYPNEGILLSDLARYRVVAWYTDNRSANQKDAKFGSATFMTALRFINSVNQLNTLAVYLRQNGKAWLFGEGITQAVANGYVSRLTPPLNGAQAPFTSGDDPRHDILQLGNFLYDFIHIRSEMNTAGTSNETSTGRQRMQSAIPYLPQFKCTSTPPTNNRTCDPRIGPSAERTAAHWNDLPQLTMRAYRDAPDPVGRRYWPTFIITQPNFITEGTGPAAVSVLDTLYLCAAHTYDPNRTRIPPSDGFPNALWYHGTAHGELVWFGFPMHFFEYDQARQTARTVLHNFGVEPAAPGARRGASPFRSSIAPRVLADANTYDPRRVRR